MALLRTTLSCLMLANNGLWILFLLHCLHRGSLFCSVHSFLSDSDPEVIIKTFPRFIDPENQQNTMHGFLCICSAKNFSL